MTAVSHSQPTQALFNALHQLITESRTRLSQTVNSELTRLYWAVGERLRNEVLGGERAAYGSKVIEQLGAQLCAEFGRGFEAKNLRRMMQFAERFPDSAIVASLMRQLSWTHFLQILPLKTAESRLYYAHICVQENLSVRELRQRIEQKSYERTAIASSQSAGMQHQLSQLSTQSSLSTGLVFKDPYFLDFLGLQQGFLENDLEEAILRQLEQFMLELGRGFAFMERQKRMVIDGEDFYLDLLFFHRPLRRLVAIELKLGKFKAAHKGQMELYLKWLDKHERQANEEAPIGLILCAESSREQVELLEMHKDGITVAEYWTELPPKAILEQQLHQALQEAQERLARRNLLLSDDANCVVGKDNE